jgi:putative nucleotidyltransferase with HDIG domain
MTEVLRWTASRRPADRDELRLSLFAGRVLAAALRTVVAAIDARDPLNAAHSYRVSQLSVRLGQAIGLYPEEQERLEVAALLHDIGKLRVPEQILLKPGALEAEEWEEVKLHPVYGAEIVAEAGMLSEIARVVRHHHEWMDGSGYPDGLRGEAIPRLARILSIADAYEAMTAHRAYRPAMPPWEARALIRERLGIQFDPELGAVFLDLLDLPY